MNMGCFSICLDSLISLNSVLSFQTMFCTFDTFNPRHFILFLKNIFIYLPVLGLSCSTKDPRSPALGSTES